MLTYPEEMENDHLLNAIKYHERKMKWHAERVEQLKRERRNRPRRKYPKEIKTGYAAVWQGGRLVHFRGDWDEYLAG